VTYFVKAGTQPLLFLFLVTWALKLLWDWRSFRWRERRGRLDEGEQAPPLGTLALQGGLVSAIYLLLLTPYFIGTHKKFGDPLYSVYTEYMMWLPMEAEGSFQVNRDYMWAFYYSGARSKPIIVDDFNRSLERTVRSRLKREGKGKLTAEQLDARVAQAYQPVAELPNRKNYFARYPLGHGVDRVANGFTMLEKRIRKYYKRAMSMVDYAFKLALAGLLLRGGRWLWRRYRPGKAFIVEDLAPRGALIGICARHPYLLFYALGFFVGYLVLYAWYDALGIGPRLMLSLYVPLLFTAILGLHFVFRGLVVPCAVRGRPLYLGKVANLLLLAVLTYLSFKLLTGELYEFANTGG